MLGLQGKTAVVFGVASEDSIAWAICQQLAEAGADLFLGYQKRFMSRVFQLKDKFSVWCLSSRWSRKILFLEVLTVC